MKLGTWVMYLVTTLLIVSCQVSATEEITHADFGLLEQSIDSKGYEKNVGIAGGAHRQIIEPVKTHNASFAVSEGMLTINLEAEGYIRIVPNAIGLPASWRNAGFLEFELENHESGFIVIEIFGSRSRIRDTIQLNQKIKSMRMDIKEIGLIGGLDSQPTYIQISAPSSVAITFRSIELHFRTKPVLLVDKFGQRYHARYPEKTTSETELTDIQSENLYLDSLIQQIGPLSLDKYGGYLYNNLVFEPTGFFRTQYKNDRWWLVTPEGNPFFSLGVNGVRRKSFRGNADVSRIKGRHEIFESIPSFAQCPECFREDSTFFSFYAWNVKQRYPTYNHWKYQVYKRFEAAGFNTIGNWSDTLFYKNAQLPYTLTLDTRKDRSLIMNNGLPDVFNPAWQKHVEMAFEEIIEFKHDPYLLGYFVDNEMSWRYIPTLDSMSYTWKHLNSLKNENEMMAQYAEKYFSIVHAAIRKYDSDHLYLGCRMTRNFDKMTDVAGIMGKYADVVSINVYSPYPIREEMDLWYHASGKPLLIGEHHIPPRTPKQLWPIYENFPDSEREQMISNYLFTWASYPYAVGAHWYQFRDQEVAGRENGGENQPIGIVTITDKINRQMFNVYHRVSQLLPERIGLEVTN